MEEGELDKEVAERLEASREPHIWRKFVEGLQASVQSHSSVLTASNSVSNLQPPHFLPFTAASIATETRSQGKYCRS